MFGFIKKRLSFKIMAAIIISASVVMGAELYVRTYFGIKDRIELMTTAARELASSTYAGIKHPMSMGDSEAIKKQLSEIREKTIDVEVFISDPEQLIIYSTHEDKVNTMVRDSIHNKATQQALVEALKTGVDPKRSFVDELSGKRYLVTIYSILNQEDCYHCHGPYRKVLGSLITRMSVEQTYATMVAQRNRTLVLAALGISLIITLTYLMMTKVVSRPIGNLAGKSKRFAEGDMSVSADVKTEDEIGVLGNSFNYMVKSIKDQMEYTRQAKEFNETILNSMNDAISIIDVHNFKILDVNKIFLEELGVKEEEVIGRTCYQVTHHLSEPCKPPNDPCPLLDTLRTGEPVAHEHIHYQEDGTKLYVEVSASPIRDENGVITHLVHVARNITERKYLEEQLRHSQKLEAVGQLAGGIAHDFNNILTAIIGYANFLRRKMDENDPLRTYAERILYSSERAANLTQSLLTFSRKQIINPKLANLNDIAKRVETLLSRVIGEDIELKIILSDVDLTVMVDIAQIEQVLMNLATNARDAMPEGGFLIIETRPFMIDEEYAKRHPLMRPGKYALLSLTDTGCGMDEETKARIFDPFFTTKEQGTGLGLSIVYGIIKQHNGEINVYSEPGRGTTFKILLPLVEAEIKEERIVELPPIKGGTETILVAEDEEDIRRVIRQELEEFGYTVIEAVDGDDAIEVFMRNKDEIQLVLLDVIMPKRNGREVYEKIKRTKPEVKTIFISGYTADIIHRKGILETDLEFIPKPISPDEFLRKVREVLDK